MMHPTFKIENGVIVNDGKFIRYVQQLNGIYDLIIKDIKLGRTLPQNNSMHLYFQLLSDALNEAGLDLKLVLKPEIDIPFTPALVKDHLWKPVQLAKTKKDSTTKLDTKEVTAVYDIVNKHIGEKHGVSIPFPNEDYNREL